LAAFVKDDSLALMRFAMEAVDDWGGSITTRDSFFYSFRLDEAVPDVEPDLWIALSFPAARLGFSTVRAKARGDEVHPFG